MKSLSLRILMILTVLVLFSCGKGEGTRVDTTTAPAETEALTTAITTEEAETEEIPSVSAVTYTYEGVFEKQQLKIGFMDGNLYVTAQEESKLPRNIINGLGLKGDVWRTVTYVAWGEFTVEDGRTAVTFETEIYAAYTFSGDGLDEFKSLLAGPCEGLSDVKVRLYRDRLAGVPEMTDKKPYNAMTFLLDEDAKTFSVDGYEGRSGTLKREYGDGYLAKETVISAGGKQTVTAYFPDGAIQWKETYREELLQSKTVYNNEGVIMEEFVRNNLGEGTETVYWSEGKPKSVTSYNTEGDLVLRYDYAEDGKVLGITDGEGNVMTNEYNDKGQLIVRKTTYPDGTVAGFEYRYNDNGAMIWVRSTYRDGSTMVGEYEYNEQNRPVRDVYTRSDGATRTADRVFDDMGRVIRMAEKDFDGTRTETEYAVAENEWQTVRSKVTVTLPDGTKTVTEYDLAGNITSEVRYDADGNVL